MARTFYSIIETAFFGLSLGSVLALVAIGLTITFGVMGVIKMAHCELMMLGAYTTYVVQLLMPGHLDLSVETLDLGRNRHLAFSLGSSFWRTNWLLNSDKYL